MEESAPSSEQDKNRQNEEQQRILAEQQQQEQYQQQVNQQILDQQNQQYQQMQLQEEQRRQLQQAEERRKHLRQQESERKERLQAKRQEEAERKAEQSPDRPQTAQPEPAPTQPRSPNRIRAENYTADTSREIDSLRRDPELQKFSASVTRGADSYYQQYERLEQFAAYKEGQGWQSDPNKRPLSERIGEIREQSQELAIVAGRRQGNLHPLDRTEVLLQPDYEPEMPQTQRDRLDELLNNVPEPSKSQQQQLGQIYENAGVSDVPMPDRGKSCEHER